MRSTSGHHFSRLDHVRAFAAYLVFVWHFLHMTPVYPVPYASGPAFPLALFDEGHTGVALFMTLSGYLFAKLVGPQHIDFPNFLWNRAMRLGPLLIVVLAAWFVIGRLTAEPIPVSDLVYGFILPTWPRGAWSIAIELHFYLVFPLLLFMARRYGIGALLFVVAAAIFLRVNWWLSVGEVQHLAYWTIFGRIDQFLFGMVFAFATMDGSLRRTTLSVIAVISLISFLIVWTQFDAMGGFYNRTGAPSQSPLWIVIPTIEAVTFGALIAWYDGSHIRLPAWLDRALTKAGEWSYSIYLLHFFPIIALRHYFWGREGSADDFYVAWLAATLAFIAFLPVAALSYEFFEKRFLAFRKPYLREQLAVKFAA
ncbi:MAG: acyltransferase family protein [Pseudolabrys sp.]